MWGFHSGWGMAMGIGMMLFWLLVVVLGVWAVIRYSAAIQGGPAAGNDARRILEERFARGEIDENEFRQRASVLGGG